MAETIVVRAVERSVMLLGVKRGRGDGYEQDGRRGESELAVRLSIKIYTIYEGLRRSASTL